MHASIPHPETSPRRQSLEKGSDIDPRPTFETSTSCSSAFSCNDMKDISSMSDDRSRASSSESSGKTTYYYCPEADIEDEAVINSSGINMLKSKRCTDCGRKASRKSMFNGQPRGQCANEECHAFLCKPCKKRWVLMTRRATRDIDNTKTDWRTANFSSFCMRCFMRYSTVDFNANSESIEPILPDQDSNMTVIFAHREGFSRVSFRAHAKYLAEKYGHRSILMDYPGHGSRWNEDCTAKNCVNAVREVLQKYDIRNAVEAESMGQKTVFVSSSWGGTMACHVMTELKEYFSGVVLDSCCVGDANTPLQKIRRGCYSMFVKNLSNYNQLRLLRSWWAYKGNSYVDFMGGNFGAGIFGKCNPTKAIDGKNMWENISEIKCPVLFLEGTNNQNRFNRRSLEKNICQLEAKAESKVVLFEEGDYMISHDLRFFNAWVETAARFIYHTSITPNLTEIDDDESLAVSLNESVYSAHTRKSITSVYSSHTKKSGC